MRLQNQRHCDKNITYVNDHRRRVKLLKQTDPEVYEEKMRLKRRQKRASSKRSKARKDPAYAYQRYRSVLRSVMMRPEHLFRGFFDEQHEDYSHYEGNLDKMIKAYRGSTFHNNIQEANDADLIREFVTISSSYNLFLPEKSNPIETSIVYMGKSTQLKVPSFNFKQLDSATDDCFMVHEGILYHNDLCNVRNGTQLVARRTKRKASKFNITSSMNEFLKEKGFTEREVLNSI